MSPDWLGASRRAAAALRTMLAERVTIAERVIETGTRGEGGDRTLEIDALAEEAVLAELQGLYDAGARFTVLSEEAGTVDFGGDERAGRGRPDRRLAERQARAAAPLRLDRRRRGADDGRRRVRLRAGLRARRGVGRHPRRRRDAERRAARSRRSASGAGRRTASSSSSASSRPTRAGCCSRPRGSCRSRTGCARSARSRPPCARSRPGASTACSRSRAAGRSTRPPRS